MSEDRDTRQDTTLWRSLTELIFLARVLGYRKGVIREVVDNALRYDLEGYK